SRHPTHTRRTRSDPGRTTPAARRTLRRSPTTNDRPLTAPHRPSLGRECKPRSRRWDARTKRAAGPAARITGPRDPVSAGLGLAAAPRLTGALAGEIVDLIGIDVEHDLPTTCVRIRDRDLGGILLIDLSTCQITDIDRFSCHFLQPFCRL